MSDYDQKIFFLSLEVGIWIFSEVDVAPVINAKSQRPPKDAMIHFQMKAVFVMTQHLLKMGHLKKLFARE